MFDFSEFAREVMLDALVDSLKVLAVALAVYLIIEVLEDKISGFFIKNRKKAGYLAVPLAILPQCGFSVVCTDLFSKRKLSIGTLIGVYLATSDEAIPIMIAHPDKIVPCLIMIAIKLLTGFIALLVIDAVSDAILKKKGSSEVRLHASESTDEALEVRDDHDEEISVTGCCGHHIEGDGHHDHDEHEHGSKLKKLIHPLLHSLKIFLYVLIVNLAFGTLVYFVGEDAIADFLSLNVYLSPILAVVVGLIPNCASSVVLANLYVSGGLSFGACVAGLCANAGLGLTYLLKNVKDVKRNLTVVGLLVLISLVVGYATLLIELAV